MSDQLNLDAMSANELREQCDVLGIEYTTRDDKAALKAKLAVALGMDEGDESEAAAPAPVAAAKTAKAAKPAKERMFKVTIAKTEKEKGIVPLSVNGITQPVKRGEPIVIKERYVEVLRNAIKVVWDEDAENESGGKGAYVEVPAYPFTAEPVEG